jgi:hypothetical protein
MNIRSIASLKTEIKYKGLNANQIVNLIECSYGVPYRFILASHELLAVNGYTAKDINKSLYNAGR